MDKTYVTLYYIQGNVNVCSMNLHIIHMLRMSFLDSTAMNGSTVMM